MTRQTTDSSPVPLRSQLLVYVVATLAVVFDQYTKALVRTGMVLGETIIVHPALRNIFDLTYTTNTGVAFGMFKNAGPFIIVLAALIVGCIMY